MADWEQLEVNFVGPAPPVPESSVDWGQQTFGSGFLLAEEAAEGKLRFASAWNQTFDRVFQIFFERFAAWAVRVVAEFGVDRFEAVSIPDPPVHGGPRGLPLLSRGATTAAAWLTGTADTCEAGLRIIFWAAAASDPSSFERSADFSSLLLQWLAQVIDIYWYETDDELWDRNHYETQDEPVDGRCRPLSEVMQWIVAATDKLIRVSKKQQDDQTNSDDFVPASLLAVKHFPTYKLFKKFLGQHPEIRTKKPSTNRLVVHASDFIRAKAARDAQHFDALGLPAEMVDAFIAETKKRQAKLLAKTTRKK